VSGDNHSSGPGGCRIGVGGTQGFVPLDNPSFIGGSMKIGAPPPAANPDNPTSAESAVVCEKIAEYQAVFNTH
jgi:hypothetical protein